MSLTRARLISGEFVQKRPFERLRTSRRSLKDLSQPMIYGKISAMDLSYFARKYIWWQIPGTEVASPHRVIAQVMNIGTFEDVQELLRQVGEGEFRKTLHEARPGEFSERSWHYWHLALGVTPLATIPPLPVRHFA